MSNPTTHVNTFDGSAPDWSITGPERYDDGLWLEEGTTNLLTNPSFETNLNAWSISNSILAQSTLHPAAGTKSMEVTATAAAAGAATSVNLAATSHALSATVYNAAAASRTIALRFAGVDGTTMAVAAGVQQRFSRVVTGMGAASYFVPRVTDSVAGELFYFDALQIEEKAYATSYTDTARAASSASISPSGILSPSSGALAFRITPTIETGVEEIWGECGAKGSGADHVRWGRDSTKHPFCEWSANDAAYQRLTASETIDAGQKKFLYFGYSGTATSLQVDSGTLHTGSRDAVSDSFGAGPIKLQGSAGGNVVGPFATYERPLTAGEISAIINANRWTISMLEGSLVRRQFVLQPY